MLANGHPWTHTRIPLPPASHRPTLLLLPLTALPAVAQAEGGVAGAATLLLGLPGMLLAVILGAILLALARHRAARITQCLLVLTTCIGGISLFNDARALLRRDDLDLQFGLAFLALWATVLALGYATWRRRRDTR